MFRRLTRLFFGENEDNPTAPATVKCGEIVDDEWLLVPHKESGSEVSAVENKTEAELANTSVYRSPSNPAIIEETATNIETRLSESGLSVQKNNNPSRVLNGFVSQAGALAKVTQIARIQRAQALSDRHFLGRTGIQRQNCVRQRAERRSSRTRKPYLQQPGRCNASH